jgi:hypothetical protein
MSFAVDGVRAPARAASTLGPASPSDDGRGAQVVAGNRLEAGSKDSPFARVLSGLGKAVAEGERTMDRVRSAGQTDLGAGELLALQSEVYRYSEAVDLSAKLVDRVTNGIKTVIQGQ